jgi:hypothetical protein
MGHLGRPDLPPTRPLLAQPTPSRRHDMKVLRASRRGRASSSPPSTPEEQPLSGEDEAQADQARRRPDPGQEGPLVRQVVPDRLGERAGGIDGDSPRVVMVDSSVRCGAEHPARTYASDSCRAIRGYGRWDSDSMPRGVSVPGASDESSERIERGPSGARDPLLAKDRRVRSTRGRRRGGSPSSSSRSIPATPASASL